jgi:cytochrome c biogenesis protein CcmG/thiol:disulfide interchange protein DsbE
VTAVDVPQDAPDEASEEAPVRSGHTARWVALGLAVLMVAFVGVLATRKSAESTLANSPLLGKPAPEITGAALDGTTVKLSDYDGRFVVLNFFASWCVPCREEHDDLIRFSEEHKAKGDAVVLAVMFDDEPVNARAFFEQRGGDWPVLADPNGKVALDFGVRGPPESYVIAPDGTVLAKYVGQVTDTSLDRLLAQAEGGG